MTKQFTLHCVPRRGAATAGLAHRITRAAHPVYPFRARGGPNGLTCARKPAPVTPLVRTCSRERPGASTVIGTEVAARAPADGYTILIMSPSYTSNPFIRSKLPYDSIKDFTGVTRLVSTAMVIAAHPSVPAKNVKDLVGLARAQPGMLTYGTASVMGANARGRALQRVRKSTPHVPFTAAHRRRVAVGGHHAVGHIVEIARTQVRQARRGRTTIKFHVMPECDDRRAGFPGFGEATVRRRRPLGHAEAARRPRNADHSPLNLPEVRTAACRGAGTVTDHAR